MTERCLDIRFVATIEHPQFFKICKHRNWDMTVPAIPNCLKIKERIVDSGVWLLCFHEEACIPKVGGKKRVVRALSPFAGGDAALNLYFLFVWIGLLFVVNIPAEGNPELVDKIQPGLGFGIAGR